MVACDIADPVVMLERGVGPSRSIQTPAGSAKATWDGIRFTFRVPHPGRLHVIQPSEPLAIFLTPRAGEPGSGS